MVFRDKTLVCVECGESFIFSSDDQIYHIEKGYREPKRCPECRRARRAQRAQQEGYGGREMYKIICAQCGAEAEVPFRPRGDRPVYCNDCYAQTRRRSGY